MLRHIVVSKEYNFESDVESHINGNDLSELSDTFDDDATTVNQKSSFMKRDTSIALDEISYSRDLNMINVPSSSKSKTLLLVRDNDRSNRKKGAADAVDEEVQKRRQGSHRRDTKDKQVASVDKSKKSDQSKKEEQRLAEKGPRIDIQMTEVAIDCGDDERIQQNEKSNAKLSRKQRKNNEQKDFHRAQRPAIVPSLVEGSLNPHPQENANRPIDFKDEQENGQGRSYDDEQWAHRSRRVGGGVRPSHFSNSNGEFVPGSALEDTYTTRKNRNFVSERTVAGRQGRGQGRGRAGRGSGRASHRQHYATSGQEYDGYYDQPGSYFYDDYYGQDHSEYGEYGQTEYYSGDYHVGENYYQPDSEYTANKGYNFLSKNSSHQQAKSNAPDRTTQQFVTATKVEADLAAVAALNPNADEFVPSFSIR